MVPLKQNPPWLFDLPTGGISFLSSMPSGFVYLHPRDTPIHMQFRPIKHYKINQIKHLLAKPKGTSWPNQCKDWWRIV